MAEPARTYAPNTELNALLGRGSEFDGKLSFEGTVRIDGTFSGEITTNDTLIVGEGAKVHAEITCGTLVVHGDIVGNIHAADSVELHKPAKVKGDIATASLLIERGVLFQGNSKMEEPATSNVVRFGTGGSTTEEA
jgi:cytoskeletal protein CcmA (bactofilin family)